MKRVSCKEYYDYVMKQLKRVGGNNIAIYGDMPKRCWDYFKRRGIKVSKEPLGWLRFKEIKNKHINK